MRRIVSCVVVFLATAFARVSAATMSVDDTYKLVSIANPAFSPDGATLAYVERRVDVARDERVGTLYVVDVATGAKRALTVDRDGVAAPAFAPNGGALAFLANDARKHAQVYVMPLGGGDARAVTRAPQGVQQFAWRPDGDALAYVASDPDPKRSTPVAKAHDFFELGDDDYLTRSYAPPSHLWLVSRAGTNDRRLTSGTWSAATSYPPAPPASPLSWSPDGRSLLFTRVPNTRDGDAYRSQIERLDVAGRAIRPLTGNVAFEGFATYSPDGSKIAYVASRAGDPNNVNDVFVTTPAGGPGKDVTLGLDRAFFRAQWFADGSLLVGAHDGTRTKFWRLRTDGSATPLDVGDVEPAWSFWIDAAIAPSGAIAFPGSSSTHPTELWLLAAGATRPAALTDVNHEVASRTLGRVADVAWTNDGYREDGVLVYPPNYVAGKRYPLVLLVHGGPQASSQHAFDAFGQVLAARGWLVFEPNYRGSDNLGNAYERAIYMDAGAGPGRDAMAGVAAVEALGIVDTTRMAVSGWSYGGFMTSWLMAHYHPWRTAISGAAVDDWRTMYDLGDANVQIAFSFKGSPYVGNDAAAYRAQSPITYAKATRCPVLIVSDVGDVRVPIAQSFAMYHLLRDNHVPVRFVGIPVDGHFPSDPIRAHDVFALWGDWIAQHFR